MSIIPDLAKMLKETARFHEESGLQTERDHLGNFQMNMSLQDAAKKACCTALWFPVWLLLHENWNDALDWADEPHLYEEDDTDADKRPVKNIATQSE